MLLAKSIQIDPHAIYDDVAICSALSIGPGTLLQSRRGGTLRFTRKGKRIFYLGQWVLDWLVAKDELPEVPA